MAGHAVFLPTRDLFCQLKHLRKAIRVGEKLVKLTYSVWEKHFSEQCQLTCIDISCDERKFHPKLLKVRLGLLERLQTLMVKKLRDPNMPFELTKWQGLVNNLIDYMEAYQMNVLPVGIIHFGEEHIWLLFPSLL